MADVTRHDEKCEMYRGKYKRLKEEFIQSKRLKLQEVEKTELEKKCMLDMQRNLHEAYGEINQLKETIALLDQMGLKTEKEIVFKTQALEDNEVEIDNLKDHIRRLLIERRQFQELCEENRRRIQEKEWEIDELNQQNSFLHDDLSALQSEKTEMKDKIKLIMSRAMQLTQWANDYGKRTQTLRKSRALQAPELAGLSLFLKDLQEDLHELKRRIFQNQSDNSGVTEIF